MCADTEDPSVSQNAQESKKWWETDDPCQSFFLPEEVANEENYTDGVLQTEHDEDMDSNRCQVGNYQSTSSNWKSGNTRWANRRGGTGEKDSNSKCRDITWGYLVYNSRYGEKYCEARSKMAASSDSKVVTIFVAVVVLGVAACIGISIAWKVTSKRSTAARTVEDGVS